MVQSPYFDKKEEYEKEIEAKARKVVELCERHGIPCFFTACITNDEHGSSYKNEGNLCGSRGFHLTDDQITKHLSVSIGFDTIPKRKDLEIIMDDPDMMLAE